MLDSGEPLAALPEAADVIGCDSANTLIPRLPFNMPFNTLFNTPSATPSASPSVTSDRCETN